MGIEPIIDPESWAAVPFHLWSAMLFALGCIVGSFLNVCIYRMPLDLSVVSPPSHCPHCKYSIPWYLNIPLLTWLTLRGRCRNCDAPISIRYFLVELLTGVVFLACWLKFGHASAAVAVVYAFFIAGLIAATFIDFEHYIIPDEITIGGIVVGFLISFVLPSLHGEAMPAAGLRESVLGIVVGWVLIYAILRAGKVMFGRHRLALPADALMVFGETSLHLPDGELPYGDIFYRDSDTIVIKARRVELVDRCYGHCELRLSQRELRIGDDAFDPDHVRHMEVVAEEAVLPREAMGFGDVKFMAAIGAFLGWKATIFSLMVSSMIGACVGGLLIATGNRERGAKLPYGPYIALATVIWMFWGREFVQRWWNSFAYY